MQHGAAFYYLQNVHYNTLGTHYTVYSMQYALYTIHTGQLHS